MSGLSFTVELGDDLTLPPGRFPMGREEIASIWGFNEHRQELLSDAWSLVDMLNVQVPVRSVWIGGSFLSHKELPSDIDMTLIVDREELRRRKDVLLGPKALPRLVQSLGFAVDVYAIGWSARHSWETSALDRIELSNRGYWDDWWLRARARSAEESKDTVASPRKGYVEVMVSGYTQG